MKRAFAGMLLGWVAVVATMSGAVWFAIDHVSRTVVSGPAVAAGPVTPLPTTTPSSLPTTAPKPTVSPRPTTTPHPATSPRTSSSAPSPQVPPPAPPTTRVMSFGSRGGSVTVACTGSRIRLVAASPVDGYRTSVDGGSQELEVTFRSERSDDVTLKLTCRDGIPVRLDSTPRHDG